jgi:hypothetical protein
MTRWLLNCFVLWPSTPLLDLLILGLTFSATIKSTGDTAVPSSSDGVRGGGCELPNNGLKLSGNVPTKCRSLMGNVHFSYHKICCIIEISIIVSHISSDSCSVLRAYSEYLNWNTTCRCGVLIVISKSFLGTNWRYDLGTAKEFSSYSISPPPSTNIKQQQKQSNRSSQIRTSYVMLLK